MKVYVLGDVHGDTRFFRESVQNAIDRGCQALVQLGDFGLWWPGPLGNHFMTNVRKITTDASKDGLKCFVLPGNHENWDEIDRFLISETGSTTHREPVKIYSNLTYLPLGATFKLGDTVCMAFGGAVSVDKKQRNSFFSGASMKDWWPQEAITELDCLAAQVKILEDKPTTLFTHAVPGLYDVPFLKPLRVSQWASMADEVEQEQLMIEELLLKFAYLSGTPFDRIYHGHTHVRYDKEFKGAKVVGLAHNETSIVRKENWIIDIF